MNDEPDILLRLPDTLRGELKEPLGAIHTDMGPLVDAIEGTLITVGDVVSYHCGQAGRSPDIAVIDGRTKRSAVDPKIEEALADHDVHRYEAVNPPGTITRSLLEALLAALEDDTPAQVIVDGEEDLAALPAILAAPETASILYGQPDEGVVHVSVGPGTRARASELLQAMNGDVAGVFALLDC